MEFTDKFYIGETLMTHMDLLKENCASGDVSKWEKEYVIILSLNPRNLLELIPVKELKLPYYREEDITVVGFASDKKEAVDYTARIVEEVYRQQGNMDIKKFFGK